MKGLLFMTYNKGKYYLKRPRNGRTKRGPDMKRSKLNVEHKTIFLEVYAVSFQKLLHLRFDLIIGGHKLSS